MLQKGLAKTNRFQFYGKQVNVLGISTNKQRIKLLKCALIIETKYVLALREWHHPNLTLFCTKFESELGFNKQTLDHSGLLGLKIEEKLDNIFVREQAFFSR